jgi:type VI secretion system protein ImpA
MLDIEQLLAPISESQPCGEDISFSPELDAISNARRADDPTLEQGAWVTTLKEADWKFVAKRCAQLIQERSKDLQLAVWLAEASAKTSGIHGLGDALLLIGGLCERYWDHVYPLPDEGGFEQRIGNLHWIASRAPQIIFEISITEGGAFSMKGAEAARVHGGDELEELEAARRRSSRAFYEVLMHDLDHCAAALADLERVVDDRVGQDGPSFSAAKAALQSVIHFVTPSAKEIGAVASAGPDAPVDVDAADTPAPRAISSGPIQNRAQALAQLRIVADFFRRTEPHSPVAYLAEKAATWGEQPLHVWLRGVVKDDSTLLRLEELLGVENK